MMAGLPFDGVFSIDELPSKPGICGIVNFEPSSEPGSHWVAYFDDPNAPWPEYFDSFGAPPPTKIEAFLRKSTKHGKGRVGITMQNQQLQKIRSNRCGYFCVQWLKSRLRGMDPEAAVYQFTQKPSNFNERKVVGGDISTVADALGKINFWKVVRDTIFQALQWTPFVIPQLIGTAGELVSTLSDTIDNYKIQKQNDETIQNIAQQILDKMPSDKPKPSIDAMIDVVKKYLESREATPIRPKSIQEYKSIILGLADDQVETWATKMYHDERALGINNMIAYQTTLPEWIQEVKYWRNQWRYNPDAGTVPTTTSAPSYVSFNGPV